MTNEELLQNTLGSVIQRMAKQTSTYETEIANLNAQILMLNDQIGRLSKGIEEKSSKPVTSKNQDKDG